MPASSPRARASTSPNWLSRQRGNGSSSRRTVRVGLPPAYGSSDFISRAPPLMSLRSKFPLRTTVIFPRLGLESRKGPGLEGPIISAFFRGLNRLRKKADFLGADPEERSFRG